MNINKRGTRAIWAGPSEFDKDESEDWPCPIRIIKIKENEINNLEHVLINIVKSATELIVDRELWSCAYNGRGPYLWDEVNVHKRNIGGVKMTE